MKTKIQILECKFSLGNLCSDINTGSMVMRSNLTIKRYVLSQPHFQILKNIAEPSSHISDELLRMLCDRLESKLAGLLSKYRRE